jgi:hypothetical protein
VQRVARVTAVCAVVLASCSGTGPERALSTAEPPEPAPTTVHPRWRAEAADWCSRIGVRFTRISRATSVAELTGWIEDHDELRDAMNGLLRVDLPRELVSGPSDVHDLARRADAWMDRALVELAAGNVGSEEFTDTALGSVEWFRHSFFELITALAFAGVDCA